MPRVSAARARFVSPSRDPSVAGCEPGAQGLAALLEAIDGNIHVGKDGREFFACGLSLRSEVISLEDLPLAQHRHDDLVAMLLQVVDARDGDLDCLATKALDAVAGHREVADVVGNRPHREVGRKVERCGVGVAVEHHVKVLIECNAGEELLGDRVLGGGTGVAMRHPGGELLEGDVRKPAEESGVDSGETSLHVGHARPLELDRIDGSRHEQVVADSRAVTALLSRPAPDPRAPCTIAPHVGGDLVVVAREVVFGEEVDDEARARRLAEPTLLGGPLLASEWAIEILGLVPRNVLVREPLLGRRQVSVELPLHDRLEVDEESLGGQVIGESGHGTTLMTRFIPGVRFSGRQLAKTSHHTVHPPSLKKRTTSHREVGTMNQRRETRPEEVLSQTAGGLGEPGDAADQAVRLRLLMEAEAVDEGRAGRVWDPSIEGVPYPLEDVEDVLAMEDAQDSSNDSMHAGGLVPNRWVPAEEAAMHVVDPQRPDELSYLDDPTDAERSNSARDDFEGAIDVLTPEDETLLGVDPYDAQE